MWQSMLDPDNLLRTVSMFFMTNGRFYDKAMRMTATAAMDINTNKKAAKGILRFNKFLNSGWVKRNFAFQALSSPFRVYAEGVTTPLLEEKPVFRELSSIEIEDIEARKRLLNDPGFNDSGAHLTNMAYCDGNLRTIKNGGGGFHRVSQLGCKTPYCCPGQTV